MIQSTFPTLVIIQLTCSALYVLLYMIQSKSIDLFCPTWSSLNSVDLFCPIWSSRNPVDFFCQSTVPTFENKSIGFRLNHVGQNKSTGFRLLIQICLFCPTWSNQLNWSFLHDPVCSTQHDPSVGKVDRWVNPVYWILSACSTLLYLSW